VPIASGDLQYRYSGGAANADPNASLGGAKSSTQITNNTANNLWDNVAGDEHAAGADIEYRGIYVHNAHATLVLQGSKFWIDSLTSSADTEFDIAAAGEGVNVTMETIANESTAPVGEVFSRPTTKAAGITLGNIPAGQHHGLWIRRTVNQNAAAANDTGSIRVEGDTDP
jgi:hypothetical protein